MGSHTQHKSPAGVEQWAFHEQAAAEQIPQGNFHPIARNTSAQLGPGTRALMKTRASLTPFRNDWPDPVCV
jgi:hypothetical protein